MPIQIQTDTQLFPPLVQTVADKDGLHTEWTEAGANMMRHLMLEGSIFSRLFPTLETEMPTSCKTMFSIQRNSPKS